MKSFTAVAALVASANAYAYAVNSTSLAYETTIVSTISTVCEGPTEIPVGPSSTITVTGHTTVIVTDCPCTLTYPVAPTTAPAAPSSYAPSESSSEAPAVPTTAAPVAPVYPTGSNGTAPAAPTGSGAAPTTGAPTTGAPTPTEFPGAAGKAGLSLVAVAGALAAFL
jgi:hypothetical protein